MIFDSGATENLSPATSRIRCMYLSETSPAADVMNEETAAVGTHRSVAPPDGDQGRGPLEFARGFAD